MKFTIFNTFKGFFLLALIGFFCSCGAGENSEEEVVEEEMVEVEVEEIEAPPSSVSEDMISSTAKGKLAFEPSAEDQKRYTILKNFLQKNKATFSNVVQSNRLSKYKSIMGLSPQKIIKTSEDITSQDLKTFLTQRSMNKSSFDSEMNNIGSVLGFSLIENFGNSKDQGKYLDMSLQVKQLISSRVVTNVDELRSKMFQAELNSKMTPAPGNENLKIEVGEDGKVYIKQ